MDALGGDLNKKCMHVTKLWMGLEDLRSDTLTFFTPSGPLKDLIFPPPLPFLKPNY